MSGSTEVRRRFDRAAAGYDAAAALQRRVCDRLLSMLPESAVCTALDLGCGTGYALPALMRRLPDARVLALDFAPSMLGRCDSRSLRVCADAHQLPLAPSCVDLVFSSLALQWCDLPGAWAEVLRVAKPGATVLVATVVEGTLAEIDHAFDGDARLHTLRFKSEHTVRRLMFDTHCHILDWRRERAVLHYPDARSLLQANRDIGASSVPERGVTGLMGRRRWQSALQRLEALRTPEGIPLGYELLWLRTRTPAVHS